MKQQKRRQRRNDGDEAKKIRGHVKEGFRARGGETGKGRRSVKGQNVDCAAKVRGQLCNVKAVKRFGRVETKGWTSTSSPWYWRQTNKRLIHNYFEGGGCYKVIVL